MKMSYVSNIANSIRSRLSNTALLGPEMYTAIAEWEKREIPAAIVLIAIDEVCKQSESHCEAIEIDMFENVVIRNFRAWLAQGGGDSLDV